jgi:NAD(P)-dependent dehydrogenase (short-subunit alcohol dehydrogenase family)
VTFDDLPALPAASLFDLRRRVIIVTGASSGIGAMLARGLAGEGAYVALAARRKETLDALADELPNSLPVRCDLTVEDDRAMLVQAVLDRFGRIDGLVNNAAMSGSGVPATRQSTAEFRDVVELDLVAPFDLAKRCLPAFRAQGGGSVVNVTSTAAILSCAYVIPQAAYCAAKGGLAQLTKELAAQWGRYNVRVNAVAPGFFATEMTATMTAPEGGANTRLMARVPLRRGANAADALGIVQFLVSEASTFVTGQHIAVDGGYTIS